MKVLLRCEEDVAAERLVLALRMRWPDLEAVSLGPSNLRPESVERIEPDLIVLCRGDDADQAWDAISQVRRRSDAPIMVTDERGGETDVVKALNAGADDYIRLPSTTIEIVARAMALIRRAGIAKQVDNGKPITCGALTIDPSTHEVYLESGRLDFTPTEFKLLHLLVRNRHVTLSQRFIQRVIWSGDGDAAAALKKYVQRLRRKLGDDAKDPHWIKTVHGVGYRFSAPDPTAT